MTSVDMWKTS